MAKKRTSSKASTDSKSLPDHHAALDDIDRLFHEKARLGIMTTVIGSADGLGFNELKELCDLTDGNLNRHLKVLVENRVLSVKKTGQGRTTHSHYRLTSQGRKAFEKYLNALEQILLAAQNASSRSANSTQAKRGSGQLGLES